MDTSTAGYQRSCEPQAMPLAPLLRAAGRSTLLQTCLHRLRLPCSSTTHPSDTNHLLCNSRRSEGGGRRQPAAGSLFANRQIDASLPKLVNAVSNAAKWRAHATKQLAGHRFAWPAPLTDPGSPPSKVWPACKGRRLAVRLCEGYPEPARKPLLHLAARSICWARSFDLEVSPWAPTRLTSCISHPGPA